MRWRPLMWLVLSLLFFIGAAVFWQLGDRWAAETRARGPKPEGPTPAVAPMAEAAAPNLSLEASLAKPAPQATATNSQARLAHRLSNTQKKLGELMRSEHAVLLENALLDTAQGTQLPIPEHLRASGDAGSYIVQSRQALDDAFRSALKQAGATIVSYIPNNAYLVRASAAAAAQLRENPQTQSVLAYEPYFKLKEPLLKSAIEQTPMPEGTTLNVVLFADTAQATAAELKKLGAEVVGGDTSPFGPVAKVKPTANSLVALAGLPGVKELELARPRLAANDLSRLAMGIAEDTVTNANYLGLSGSNVLVNINDFGVDTNHPDLAGRVLLDTNDVNQVGGRDRSGHGTFEAGIIAGDGTKSDTVTNAQGSIMPGVAGQFRGKAPGAKLLSLSHSAAIPQRTYQTSWIGGFLDGKVFDAGSVPDFYLQQTAARAGALVSNNGWNYGQADYDISAASFDAAVRDSLPLSTNSQPLVYVFAAGNAGGGADDGTRGSPDSILSPATAKNVITVGAVEQYRYITNEVSLPDISDETGEMIGYTTNTPWIAGSDSTTQVAGFSSRGNVGVGLESDNGRFKPDVVAPGSWVISTRSGQWDEQAYYNPTSHISHTFQFLLAQTNTLWLNSIFVPANTVAMSLSVGPNVKSTSPFPDLVIYAKQSAPPTNSYDAVGTNSLTMVPPDLVVDTGWYYGVSNPSSQAVYFNLHTDLTVTNNMGNYLEVLSNLNNTLGPYYRYESGSSMAAAAVSGTLALMEEFFTQRMGLTNSPALMKALLINGARPLSADYDLQVQKALNAQGWGQVYLPTTLPVDLTNSSPASGAPMLFFDQNPTTALATGQSRTYTIKVSEDAVYWPLSVTLVWTDPPGDPAAATKLVNDLDLIVTNLDTGDVFFGNDIPAGSTYNRAWNTNNPPSIDMVNNVENVFLRGFGTNYSVTVVGRRVNVSAVPAQPDNITQDYALVMSSAYGFISDALTLTNSSVFSTNAPLVTFMTNSFVGSPNYTGGVLTNQHVGANPPLVGTNQLPLGSVVSPNPWGGGANGELTFGATNQWHFYAITNENGFTNAAFMTVDSLNLSVPRMGATNVDTPENATRAQPDIDLFVSTDTNLLTLDSNAISNSVKSLSRVGNETIVISNAVQGVYYIGVKSEDQMAAQYTFVGVFSLLPFSTGDANGNQLLRGFVVPAAIPDAYKDKAGRVRAGVSTIYAIAPVPLKVHRAIVTNVLSHGNVGDLIGTLTHSSDAADLNNHTTNSPVVNQWYIYDDSQEHNVPNAHQSDGPRTLHNFAGKEGSGQWLFRESDTAKNHLGTNDDFAIFLEKQQDLTDGIIATILPGACREDFVDVPDNATNLTINVVPLGQSGQDGLEPDGPMTVTLCPLGAYGADCKSITITNLTIGVTNSVSIDIYDIPPLVGGTYSVMTCNQGKLPATVFIQAVITYNTGFAYTALSGTGGPVVIQDDAVTYAYLTNRAHAIISGLDVGLLISDPRLSDLAITLVSPNGTRVLLMENRGAYQTNGAGNFILDANGVVMQGLWSTNLAPFWRSSFETAPVGIYMPGALFEGWSVLSNSVLVYPEMPAPWLSNNVLLLEYGAISNTLPTTNSTQYQLSFNVTHAPYLVGTVGWWPLDGDGTDLFGGHDGLLSGDVSFVYTGKVDRAYFGDGVATRMVVPACPDLNVGTGRGLTIEGWVNPAAVGAAVPLVEWMVPTNVNPQGVQFWLSGLSSTNAMPGTLWANFWDTNLQPHIITTMTKGLTNGLTNGGWQHVALTYDATSFEARLYTNGQVAVAQLLLTNDQAVITNIVPRTLGDLYFGFDPATFNSGPAAPATVTHYDSFNLPTGLALVGSATNVGPVLRLTPATSSLLGNAWLTSKQRCAVGFDTHFQFQITNPGGTNHGAEGFYFTVQNFDASATNYFSLLGGVTNYVSVFFNTFSNRLADTNTQVPDISDNSIGILTNGVYLAQTDLNLRGIHLKDGAVHMSRILFDGTALTVWLDDLVVLDHILLPGLKTATDSAGYGWVGFGGATAAGGWETHDILNWDFRPAAPGAVLAGGLDEFGLYDRALTECEIAAIFQAGSAGKYGTNVLWCPLTNSPSRASLIVQVDTVTTNQALYSQTFYFTNGLNTNGLTWTNGPVWETNVLTFTNALFFNPTNPGPATNLTGLVLSGADPNTLIDEVVLSSVVTNYLSSFLHFTDNTNLAVLPIKYAPTPYSVSNFPPTLIFSNNFENVTQRVYQAGSILPGSTNNPALGRVVWVVTNGPVTLVSNSLIAVEGTNCLALSTNGVLCTLPTAGGHRYQLTYSVRGPAAISWWNGETEPLSRRAWDLLGGNNAAYVAGATNNFGGLVGRHSFYFNGQMEVPPDPDIYPQDVDDPGSALEMADSANLKLTNSFTIEGWIRPMFETNGPSYCGRQQLFFRGFPDVFECSGAGDPYWLALDDANDPWRRDLRFHIGDAQFQSLGADVFTTNAPIVVDDGTNPLWYHIAAVFERPYTNVTLLHTNFLSTGTNTLLTTNYLTFSTNALRLYLNGVCIVTNYTLLAPYADIDPAFSPGVAIGGRCQYDFTQPYRGLIDELTVYGRALTPPEIGAICTRRGRGKADLSVVPGLSLAKVNVSIDGVSFDTAYGDNARWTTRTITFTAEQTNAVLALRSLLPGTLIGGITLTEIPAELNYQPESPLDVLNGEDAYGVWTLELWDNRGGPVDLNALLLNWQLNFTALPTNTPPIIALQHGITYTNTLGGHGVQNFLVPMPQWAIWATNVLEFAKRHNATNLLPVEVWFNTNQFPAFTTNDTLLLAGSFGATNLTVGSTNLTAGTNGVPWVTSGQAYYLAVTNPNPVAIDFAVGVWFDITSLTNCQSQSNFVSEAGIPRYFQLDVPGDELANGVVPGNVSFWLSAAQTNLTMVLSQHLPLPDLTHRDFVSQWPSTNQEIVMVVSNSTPLAIQTNRWYVGVFNSAATNVPFTIQACYVTNYPTVIKLTNDLPYFASFTANTNLLAPAGPPRNVFFQFSVTNWTDGLLFELYGLSGNADLVLQRNALPTMAPYFDGSFQLGTHPEQIVVRTSPQIADLRGDWYLGIYNNEYTNVAYTVRAVTSAGGMLLSGQPLVSLASLMPAAPGQFLLQWNSIEGENYVVDYTDTLLPNPIPWQPLRLPGGGVTATTPLSTVQVPIGITGMRFYRIGQVPTLPGTFVPLMIQVWQGNQIRLTWPDSLVGYTLQYATGPYGPWMNLNLPVTDDTVAHLWVVYDTLGSAPKYYRLIP